MSRVRKGLAGALGALLLIDGPHLGHAAEPTKAELAGARDLFARAERDEDAGRWAEALDKLQRASNVKMTPGIRFHIALCEEKIGHLTSALEDYVAAETAARAEGNKEVLDAVTEPMSLLRARIPTLAIRMTPDAPNAEVTLDGKVLAQTMLGVPIPVDVGTHSVAASAAGRIPFSSSVDLMEKQILIVDVRLPLPAAPVLSSVRPAPIPPTRDVSSRQAGPPRADAWATTVGAAAIAGFGVAAYFVAGSKQSSAETQCLTEPSCDNLKGGVRTWDALALSSWIVAGVGSALAIYLWVRPASKSENVVASRLFLGPGSLRWTGTF
jgi:hypothetical protein